MDVTYVLIPGAGGSAWYWHLVERELRERGRDAIAVDLPAEDDSAGIPEYAATVESAIGDRTTSLVLVAQSMGGFTAAAVSARRAVSLLVFVNAMIPKPGETPGEWWSNTGQAEARRTKDVQEGRPPDAEFDPLITFLHDVPPNIIDESRAHNPTQSGAPFASAWSLDAWPAVPTRVLIATEDRFFPAEFQRRVAHDRLGRTPDEMPGGHLVALSHPKELVDRLEGYIASL